MTATTHIYRLRHF